MTDQNLVEYIQKAKSENRSSEQITKDLLQTGWSQQNINQALAALEQSNVPLPSQPRPSHSMWDAFEHILLFISLYIFATSFALTAHFLLDRWLPAVSADGLSYSVARQFNSFLLRWYLAGIIVSYPLFTFLFLRITKRTKANPSLRLIKSRKTLVYLTLILTVLIALINVIRTVFNFLSGNITLNFLLHLTITLLITGAIFVYYLLQVKEDRLVNA